MRHAFLIIANRDIYCLNKLIEQIDYPTHDIYLMLDKKSKISTDDITKNLKYSKLTLLNRISVNWGGFSLIEAEMNLLKSAFKGNYDYYHIISGNDLLLKNNAEFDRFFEENNTKEFITFCGQDWVEKAKDRLRYYYLEAGRNKILIMLNKIFLRIQKLLGINRLKKFTLTIQGGCNWVSITNQACSYLLKNEKTIHDIFKKTFCCDEVFIHTMIYNSEYRKNIYLLNHSLINDDTDFSMHIASQRYIDWVRGKPYVFKTADYAELIHSNLLFARKFDSSVDCNIIKMITDYTEQSQPSSTPCN